MQGNIHAIGLLAVPIITMLIIWKFRNYSFARISIAIVTGFVGAVTFAMPFTYKCGAGNNPSLQATIPAICLTLTIVFVNRNKILIPAIIFLLLSGFLLCWHFSYLVIKTETYTGEPELGGCSETKKQAEPQWHTGITGLYKY
jgi:hypothetical protein